MIDWFTQTVPVPVWGIFLMTGLSVLIGRITR